MPDPPLFVEMLAGQLVDGQAVLGIELDKLTHRSVGVALDLFGQLAQLRIGHAQLLEGDGHADGAVEVFQGLNALQRGLLLVEEIGLHAHDVDGEAAEALDVMLIDVLHPGGEDHGQGRAVGGIVGAGKLVAQLMAGPVAQAEVGQKVVVRHGGCPHHLRAGLIIGGVLQADGGLADDGLEQGLAKPIGEVHVLFVGEVALHGVGHDVGSASGRLVGRQGVGELRIVDGEGRAGQIAAQAALDAAVLHVGDDGGVAAFGTGRREGEHNAEGQGRLGLLLAGIKVPHIALVGDADGRGLGGVDGGAAADGQQEVDVFLPAKLDGLAHEGEARIGLHAAHFKQLDAGGLHTGHHSIVQAAALDGAAAVLHQHALGAKVLQKLAHLLFGVPAEHDAGRRAVNKVSHGSIPP